MFHPHFLRLFFGIPHATADAMGFVAAFKAEEDLQRTWREEREKQERATEARSRVKRVPFRG